MASSAISRWVHWLIGRSLSDGFSHVIATTGLTQLDLAKLLGVASRTVRRWMQGVCTPPAVAIKELEALARTLDEAADSVVRGMDEQGSAAAVLIVYRRDYDVPPSRGLRTVRCHRSLCGRAVHFSPFEILEQFCVDTFHSLSSYSEIRLDMRATGAPLFEFD
jgi:transcriptional regulator with XRE-family HTH domain